ncbi:hypothetical protein TCAL_07132 [Tigriopus californicus]|uniref:Transcription factor TFIIIB component B'' Myb domain-containing protein n=1 Tax=Tigriopus californicus TaxID=6832 RepID=A0A553PB13_TIGCA|nr:transcription factor TFIIIB component B'' homolog [Tigriopus californicus]TRY74874.1 hypothetical protein TCAL_07132 [Tigriopus californicus]|eukprot:TCALIF_07132-PA protein Name:"Similar to Bdp1 Transcription factor TFIIIB component B'' homolog (Mus musculus)" AED:0.11 eAED:0.14 QI:0/-1/0/1/-1/1/1/0/561
MKFRPKFRPNLSKEGSNRNRIRKISGSSDQPPHHGRIRTTSAASGGPSMTEPVPAVSQPVGVKRVPVVNRVLEEEPLSVAPTASMNEKITDWPPSTLASPPTSPGWERAPSPAPKRATEPKEPCLTSPLHDPQAQQLAHSHHHSHPASVFHRRRADHKRKFTQGVPERGQMTMFDLIYYNPQHGSRMSTSSSRRTSRASSCSDRTAGSEVGGVEGDGVVPDPSRVTTPDEPDEDLVAASATDEPQATPPAVEDLDEPDEDMPVPQVKVGPNGEIILDDESTLIETSAAKKAKEDLLKSPLVFENANQGTNYGSWGKKRKNVDWGDKETIRFYKALSIFGTDFSMMENIFKRRSRHELKMKFKKEERINRPLVDKCLREGMQFDTSIMASESEEDERVKKEKVLTARKRPQGDHAGQRKRRRVRKERSNRGYYSSSDDADESSDALNPTAHLPSPHLPASMATGSPTIVTRRGRLSTHSRRSNSTDASPMLKSLLSRTSGVDEQDLSAPSSAPSSAFPPGLLAANPSLASAVPGSLVVVGSPNDLLREEEEPDLAKEANGDY